MRIDEVEALAHQRLFVVEDHAVKVDKRLGVDKDAHIFEVVHTIAFARLGIETDVVRKPGAAAALDTEAKSPLGRGDSFLSHGYANPLQGTLSDLNALLVRRGIFRVDDD